MVRAKRMQENLSKNKLKGFTLLEVLIVIIIIGILGTLGLENYTKTRENTFDKEANTILKTMQVAEKDFYLDNTYYLGCGPTANCNLRLGLILSSSQWEFSATNDGTVKATRKTDGRTWTLAIDQTEPI